VGDMVENHIKEKRVADRKRRRWKDKGEASVCLFILFFKPSSSSKFFLFVLLNFLKLRV
jgi:hypothetical protein